MQTVLIIYSGDNGENFASDYYQDWEEHEIYELPDDADVDVFVGHIKIDESKRGKNKSVEAYLIARNIN